MNMVLTLWAPEAVKRQGLTVAVLLLPGFCLLTLAAVADPLRAAGALIRFVSVDGMPVTAAGGVTLSVQGHAGQVTAAELVVLPGGETVLTPRLRDDLRFVAALGLRLCATGGAVALLAAAGLLQGRRFSLAAGLREAFAARHPDLCPAPEGFTLDGPLATGPDGPVAADLILHLLRDLLGLEALRPILTRCGLPAPRQAADLPRPPMGPAALQIALRVLARGFARPGALAEAVAATGLSRRQLERLFAAHLQKSPARHLQELRLTAARGLVTQTSRGIDEIAEATGFQTPAHFCRLYRRQFGHSPHKSTVGL